MACCLSPSGCHTALPMLKGHSAFSSNNPFAGNAAPQLSPFLHTDGPDFPVTLAKKNKRLVHGKV